MRLSECRSKCSFNRDAINIVRNDGVVGSSSTLYFSIARQILPTVRSVTVTTVPKLEVIARIVLIPPK